MLNTGILYHGGIMVNYQCNASCRHCLYSCSPSRNPGYMTGESAENICRLLNEGRCRSVHIGGGEPFLDFEGLVMIVRQLEKASIKLEYIETNACWAFELKNPQAIYKKLDVLLEAGTNTLCISIDPFHAEFIPYGAPLVLAEYCEKAGMNYFLWKEEYFSVLSGMVPQKTHSRREMEEIISKNYIDKTAQQYGICYGGRAVNIEEEFGTYLPAENFTGNIFPCHNLLSTGHFHVDKNSCFIPPGCTGIRIPLQEAIFGIPDGKYPVFETLYNGGVSSLMKLALQQNFIPDKSGYPSKCNLCFHIRKYLCEKNYAELDKNHYDEAINKETAENC